MPQNNNCTQAVPDDIPRWGLSASDNTPLLIEEDGSEIKGQDWYKPKEIIKHIRTQKILERNSAFEGFLLAVAKITVYILSLTFSPHRGISRELYIDPEES